MLQCFSLFFMPVVACLKCFLFFFFIRVPPSGAHHVCDSVWSAVKMLSADPFTSTVEGIFVLGGTEVYRVVIFIFHLC